MVEDQVFHKGDSLGHADLGQAYQPRVRSSVEVDEFTEILVHGNEDPVFGDGPFQECPVSGVRAEFSGVQDVVSLALKPCVSLRPAQRSTRKFIPIPPIPAPGSLPL